MAITKKPRFTIPKKMGEWPDLLHEMREKRLALQRQVEEMESDEKLFKEHMINTIPKSEASGVAGREYRIQIVRKEVPQVKDLEAFRAYVLKSKDLDLLTKALNKTHAQELLEAGKKIPGLEVFDAVTVSLTKI